jgi:biotin transport system substrate-specific component
MTTAQNQLLAQTYVQSKTGQDKLSLLAMALLVVGGSIALTISAHVKIPFYPVPVTMQTLVVLLIGMSYGPRLGAVTIAAYLAQGAMGLPVFASGAGLLYMAGPTGGYLAGFLAASIVMGALAQRGWGKTAASTALAMIIGNLVIYALGVTWLANLFGMSVAINAGVLPFLYGDALKIVIAAGLMPFAWNMVSKLTGK